jgi:probable HAF family extracellular repeat protein
MYDVIDLDMGIAYAVNNQGQVAGYSTVVPGGASQPYRYLNGSKVMLPHLPTGQGATPYDINENGDIVGNADLSFFQEHPVLWQGNTITDLVGLGGNAGLAKAINNAGIVVGSSTVGSTDGTPYRGFAWSAGQIDMIPVLSGTSGGAADINDSGRVVGSYLIKEGTPRGYVWRQGETPVDLGEVFPAAINNLGHMAAQSSTLSLLLIKDGQTIDLGFLNGQELSASAINEDDDIVGSTARGSAAYIASGDAIRDLNELIPANSGWVLKGALDINDNGWIVGYGMKGSTTHGFLLIPRP